MTERTSIYRILRFATIYDAVQSLMGAQYADVRKDSVRSAGACAGDRTLDIGCGSDAIAPFLLDIECFGFEPNERTVLDPRKKYRGQFHTSIFQQAAKRVSGVDVAMPSAILQHLTDEKNIELLSSFAITLGQNRRVVAIASVFHEGENSVARTLVTLDSGEHVGTPGRYVQLTSMIFRRMMAASARNATRLTLAGA
jgi:hypothetical protein